MDAILREIHKTHEKDFESESDRDTMGEKMMEEMRRQLAERSPQIKKYRQVRKHK